MVANGCKAVYQCLYSGWDVCQVICKVSWGYATGRLSNPPAKIGWWTWAAMSTVYVLWWRTWATSLITVHNMADMDCKVVYQSLYGSWDVCQVICKVSWGYATGLLSNPPVKIGWRTWAAISTVYVFWWRTWAINFITAHNMADMDHIVIYQSLYGSWDACQVIYKVSWGYVQLDCWVIRKLR